MAISTKRQPRAAAHLDGEVLFPRETVIDRSRPIGEQVYTLLRKAIVSWRLRPGDAISEASITKRLDISRMPLREAFRQLAAEGLVVIRPQAGTYVSPVDREHWEEGRVVRKALEIEGIRRATLRITEVDVDDLTYLLTQQRRAVEAGDVDRFLELDDRFHARICNLSGLPRLWRIIDGAKAQIDRTRYIAVPEMGRAEAALVEHREILDALSRRDPAQSVDLLARHLDRSHEAMAKLFKDSDVYSGPH